MSKQRPGRAQPLFKGLSPRVCGCVGCHRLFASVADFDRHRVGEHGTGLRNSSGGIHVIDPGTRRCLTADELREKGYDLLPFRKPNITIQHAAQRNWLLPEHGYWSTTVRAEDVAAKRAALTQRLHASSAAKAAE